MTYPFSETKYLCISSFMIGIGSILLYKLGEKLPSVLLGILCLTSLNHWRDYEPGGWRQRLDIGFVATGSLLFAGITLCRSEYHIYLGLVLAFTTIALFLCTHLFERYWIVCHTSIHLYAAFFVPLLYIL